MGFAESVYNNFIPEALWDSDSGGGYSGFVINQVKNIMPIYGYSERNGKNRESEKIVNENANEAKNTENAKYLNEDALEEKYAVNEVKNNLDLTAENTGGLNKGLDENLIEKLIAENTEDSAEIEREDMVGTYENDFVFRQEKTQINLDEYQDFDALVKRFYTIDNNTMAGSSQLNLNEFLERDMTIEKNAEYPQILIYHTHSQEAFSDSVPGDASTSIVGVGDKLAYVLSEKYGYNVLHHTGEYDVDTRDEAYSNALPDIERVLSENPTIQVVIDLHRDEMPNETRLVSDVDGRQTARFMFFNGLSRTKKTGNISYLQNDNLQENLAFSFKMQLAAESYYPGLARKIYLKGYRYNMHLKPRSLLIELGAQNNTVEEAMNACDIIAGLLDKVLSGDV